MAKLSCLQVGMAVLNPRRGDWRPMLNHGWVEPAFARPDDHGWHYDGTNSYLPPMRITAEGLRALADAIDKHGQPEQVDPRTQVEAMAIRRTANPQRES